MNPRLCFLLPVFAFPVFCLIFPIFCYNLSVFCLPAHNRKRFVFTKMTYITKMYLVHNDFHKSISHRYFNKLTLTKPDIIFTAPWQLQNNENNTFQKVYFPLSNHRNILFEICTFSRSRPRKGSMSKGEFRNLVHTFVLRRPYYDIISRILWISAECMRSTELWGTVLGWIRASTLCWVWIACFSRRFCVAWNRLIFQTIRNRITGFPNR